MGTGAGAGVDLAAGAEVAAGYLVPVRGDGAAPLTGVAVDGPVTGTEVGAEVGTGAAGVAAGAADVVEVAGG